MRGIEEKPGKEARRLHSEKHACPRRGNPTAVKTVLSRRQTERGGKAFWDAEQSDRHLARCGDSRVAREPLLKVETIMRALRTGQGRRRKSWAGRETLLHLHFHALLPKQMHAHSPMKSPTPILPEERSRTDDQWMQQHAHLARLSSSVPLPLTLLPQRTGATTADAGRIHYAQAPIGFSASLVRHKRLAGGAMERAI